MDKFVYLLEGDEGISDVIECSLEVAKIKIRCYKTIKDFKQAVEKEAPSVVLLDIMLPDGNGLDVLSYMKINHPKTQCIMLSALSQEIEKVKGLNMGADDYIAKPFGTMELIARVNAALRRSSKFTYDISGLMINKETHEVTLNGESLSLNNKEFNLLLYFVENPNIVLSRDRLLEAVWGYDIGETRTIDNHILRLRKLGINQIETVFGVGYKFTVK